MEKKKNLTVSIACMSIMISLAVLLGTISFAAACKKENPQRWILQTYGNNVALFNGNKVVEVYGSIAIDTLPEADKKLLKNGIAFQTKTEALSAIEDFDG